MNSDQFNVMVTRRGRYGLIFWVAISLVAAPVLYAQTEAPTRPVIVGAGPAEDACGSVGVVSGLAPGGSNKLSVRSGPGTHYQRVDLVSTAQVLFICEQEGSWHAVVYTKSAIECGVSTPVDPAVEYGGPCRFGWVFSDYVELIAG